MNILSVEPAFYKSILDSHLLLSQEMSKDNHKIFFLAGNAAIKKYLEKNGNFKVFNIQDYIEPVKTTDKQEIINLCRFYEEKFKSTFSNPVYEIASIRSLYIPELYYLSQKEDQQENCKKALEFLSAIDGILEENSFDIILQNQGAELIRRCMTVCTRERGIKEYFMGFSPVKGMSILYQNEFAVWENITIKELQDDELKVVTEYIKQATAGKHVHKPIAYSLGFINFWIDRIDNLKHCFGINDGYNSISSRLRIYFVKKIRKYIGKTIRAFIYSKFDKNVKYVHYPLHFPAESQVTIRSNNLIDQLYLIKLIAHCLPQGVVLYVKEHPVALGTQKLTDLIEISKLPNVKLVPPSINAHELVENACAIITINSTVGFEALMHYKPVVVVGKVFYGGYGATYDVKTLNELPVKIKEALNTPVSKENINKLIHSILKASIAGDFFSNENTKTYAESILQMPDFSNNELTINGTV